MILDGVKNTLIVNSITKKVSDKLMIALATFVVLFTGVFNVHRVYRIFLFALADADSLFALTLPLTKKLVSATCYKTTFRIAKPKLFYIYFHYQVTFNGT